MLNLFSIHYGEERCGSRKWTLNRVQGDDFAGPSCLRVKSLSYSPQSVFQYGSWLMMNANPTATHLVPARGRVRAYSRTYAHTRASSLPLLRFDLPSRARVAANFGNFRGPRRRPWLVCRGRLRISFRGEEKERRRYQPQRRKKAAEQQSSERAPRQACGRRCGCSGDAEQHLHDRHANHSPRHACGLEPGGEPTDQRRHDHHEGANAGPIVAHDRRPDDEERCDDRDSNAGAIGPAFAQSIHMLASSRTAVLPRVRDWSKTDVECVTEIAHCCRRGRLHGRFRVSFRQRAKEWMVTATVFPRLGLGLALAWASLAVP